MSDATDDETAAAVEAALAAALVGPKRVRGDAGEVEMHSIGDLIKAEHHVQSKRAGRRSGFGLRITQGKPPGAV